MNTIQTQGNSDTGEKSQAVLFLSMGNGSVPLGAGGEPLAIQEQRILGYRKAGTLDARVVQEFVEIGVSARDYRKRALLLAMLTYLGEHPHVRYVIFPSLGRFSRSHADFVALQRRFKKLGVDVFCATGDIIVGVNETDAFMAQLIAAAQSI